ncbi:CbiX/SirB N-terminal domain-containing protein [Kitasatospora paracochleata]|uniref:Sirohydrochlorin ferrochelatase n=1 Tax=Kitasatospora paracochleata TaxID=58354 RepID=A0ABT1J054_9ACTN|nr:CbiX/SirB N-terminal domain-containing protein [Kitasatospora paracochleata]MCP2310486.1 sirohydrochlorin ferrochelatase [Kitasatospora paracochleata]
MTVTPLDAPPRTPREAREARAVHEARHPTLVLVAHGSRDPAAGAEIRRLLAAVRRAAPELDVRLAHLGLNAPLLPDVLDALTGPAVLVPLLLSRGYHVKVDIPAALAAAPHLDAVLAPPLGPDPLLTEALYARLAEAGWSGQPVVLAASGSRDPQAAADTDAQAVLLAARLGVPVRPGYVAAGGPGVAAQVAALAAEGHPEVAVAGYFTAPGDFARLAAAAGAGLASSPLGAHPLLARLVLDRYRAHARPRALRRAA